MMPTSHQVPKTENCSWFTSAAVSPPPCPLYLWFHHDRSAHCRSIFGVIMFLHLKVPSKLRTSVVLGFLFPFIMEMDRNDVWVCNTGCDGSPFFLFFFSFFCFKIALAARACCTHVICSHLVTQHSSKIQISRICVTKIDTVFLPSYLSNARYKKEEVHYLEVPREVVESASP